MKRREFITFLGGAAVAWPLTARAQQRAPMPIVGGLLLPPLSTRLHLIEALRQGLRQNGLVVGSNVTLAMHSADGREDRLAAVVSTLLADKPDVIVTWGTQPVQAVVAATHSVPVVMASIGDPVGAGVVSSLARPGGNVTGFSLFSTETTGKRLELLKEMVPRLRSLMFLTNPDNKSVELEFEAAEPVAHALGIELRSGPARRPEDIDEVIETAARGGADAVLTSDDQLFTSQRIRIVNAATRWRLPVASGLREFADAGALFSYGSSITDTTRRAAGYVDNILKGAKPADLPIQQPTSFELLINLKTAKALGLDVPPMLLARADEMIE